MAARAALIPLVDGVERYSGKLSELLGEREVRDSSAADPFSSSTSRGALSVSGQPGLGQDQSVVIDRRYGMRAALSASTNERWEMSPDDHHAFTSAPR
jgi:hypothetical protein